MVNRKIVVGLLIIGMASATTAYGTFAFFSDTETSSDNIFTAGDLDLTLDGLNGVTGTIVGANFAPGDDTDGSILLRNEGSIFTGDAQGHLVDLDLCVAVVDTDAPGNLDDADDGGVSLITFARWLDVTTLTYGAQDLRVFVGDADGDGRANTLHDVMTAGRFGDLADPGAAGRTLSLDVHFAEDGPNYLKRDVSTLTLTFFLAQQGEVDIDCSTVGGVNALANAYTLVYSNDFASGAGAAWSASSITTSPNGAQTFLGEFDDQDATLTLSALPPHTVLRVEFDLYIVRTWDGNNDVHGPDVWQFLLDGATIVDTTFSNQAAAQCYPADCPATNPTRTGATALDTLGYGLHNDAVYHIVLDVPHSASAASAIFRGDPTHTSVDEGWGIDNVRVLVS